MPPIYSHISTVTFQFTTSQGGRRDRHACISLNTFLSIHDLTRRSTSQGCYNMRSWQLFQFTTSQGGRLAEAHKAVIINFFQFTTSQGGRLVDGVHCTSP